MDNIHIKDNREELSCQSGKFVFSCQNFSYKQVYRILGFEIRLFQFVPLVNVLSVKSDPEQPWYTLP